MVIIISAHVLLWCLADSKKKYLVTLQKEEVCPHYKDINIYWIWHCSHITLKGYTGEKREKAGRKAAEK